MPFAVTPEATARPLPPGYLAVFVLGLTDVVPPPILAGNLTVFLVGVLFGLFNAFFIAMIGSTFLGLFSFFI